MPGSYPKYIAVSSGVVLAIRLSPCDCCVELSDVDDCWFGLRVFRNSNKQSISELKQVESIFFKLVKKRLFSGLC